MPDRRFDARAIAARRARRWAEERTFAAQDLPAAGVLAARKRGARISVALPALDEAPTVGAICRTIRRSLIEDVPLVDELVVIDGGSRDGTQEVAEAAGARVVRAADIVSEVPFVGGKGESLWRSLSILSGDIVCWVDADIRNFAPHFVTRLVAPLLLDDHIGFVKGFYRRPLIQDGHVVPDGGGRVTELLARPLLDAFFPELAGIRQPLAGEYAGRREILERLPFFTGYSVEVGLLIDLLTQAGLDVIAQADLTERVHRNRPLADLAPMANAIAHTILRRAEELGRISSAEGHSFSIHPWDHAPPSIIESERPPVALLGASQDDSRAHNAQIVSLR